MRLLDLMGYVTIHFCFEYHADCIKWMKLYVNN